jgi:hypothetical protein
MILLFGRFNDNKKGIISYCRIFFLMCGAIRNKFQQVDSRYDEAQN